MNIILQISPRESIRTACPIDAVAELGGWDSISTHVGRYEVVMKRQLTAEHNSFVTGFGRWSHGVFGWSGRIRNRQQVARKLGLPPALAPAPLISGAISRWQKEVMAHLEGPICLVVVNTQEHTVIWFRDHFGLVPALYSHHKRRLWVATSLCSWNGEAVSPESNVHEGRLAKYLTRVSDQSSQDFFCGVNRIRPGSFLSVDLKANLKSNEVCYWKPSFERPISERFYFDRLRQKLEDIVRQSVEGSRRCCVALSSGLDSTLLMASWAALSKRRAVSQPPLAASMSFPNHLGTDESKQVEAFSNALSVELCIENLEDVPPLASIRTYRAFWGYGPCVHPGETYEFEFLNRIAQSLSVDTVLYGVGGELLFPYTLQEKLKLARKRWQQSVDKKSSAFLAGWVRQRTKQSPWLMSLLGTLGKEILPPAAVLSLRQLRLQHSKSHSNSGTINWWSSQVLYLALAQQEPSEETLHSWGWELTRRSMWRQQLRTGLVLDHPYLTPALFKLASRMPTSVVQPRHWNDYRPLMRRIGAGILPEQIRAAPKHGLFEHFVWRGFVRKEKQIRAMLEMPKLQGLRAVNQAIISEQAEGFLRAAVSYDESVEFGPVNAAVLWTPLSAELWLGA